MKLYVVVYDDCDSVHVLGIFDTIEKAKVCADDYKNKDTWFTNHIYIDNYNLNQSVNPFDN